MPQGLVYYIQVGNSIPFSLRAPSIIAIISQQASRILPLTLHSKWFYQNVRAFAIEKRKVVVLSTGMKQDLPSYLRKGKMVEQSQKCNISCAPSLQCTTKIWLHVITVGAYFNFKGQQEKKEQQQKSLSSQDRPSLRGVLKLEGWVSHFRAGAKKSQDKANSNTPL